MEEIKAGSTGPQVQLTPLSPKVFVKVWPKSVGLKVKNAMGRNPLCTEGLALGPTYF